MIAANELRMGNWVMYDNRIFKIHCISETYPFLNTEEFGVGVVGFKNIEPIVLCPEILEKCGAEKFPTGKKDYSLHGVLLSYAECRDVYTHNGKELPNLHTLQNYIFALTNEELNYTP